MSSLLQAAEAHEAEAACARVEYFDGAGVLQAPILDLGCGNGYAVRELQRRGLFAVGVDRSLYRFSNWVDEGLAGRRLVVADATALPFADGRFACVVASGMLEHIGVQEVSSPYTVRALGAKAALRKVAVREMRRVSAAAVVVDFPNGWFPVDFWHGDSLGAFRVHPIPDVLNPSVREVRAYAEGARVIVLPLRDRLRFRQVANKRWGRVLAPVVRTALRVLDLLPRRSPGLALCYPFLVLRIEPR